MAPTAFRHPLVVAGVVATLGAGVIAPAASAASTPPAPQVSNQLLGGLLGGLLDTATAPLVSAVTPLLDGSTGVLPAVLPAGTIDKLTDVITGAVDGVVPADVTKLLTALTPAQLTQLVADPTTMVPLLTGILPTLTGLASGSTLSASAVSAALSQVTAVLGGGVPSSATALATLTSVVDQVAKLLGYPSVAALPAVGPLIAALATIGKALPDGGTKTAVVGAVSTAGTSLGLTPAQIASALDLLGLGRAVAKPAATTPAPTAAAPAAAAKVARARIASASISKNRRKVTYRVTCPTASIAGCRITPSVKVGGRTVKAKKATIAAGRSKTFRVAVPASVAKKVRKAGGKVVLRLKTAGSTAGAVTKTVRISRAA
ncbi:hypothetical protein [Patulibacter sp.]|uniref:hypothetical protein n=1 Tax=Patulibacter sp. TaxID=1912859 RepID=UPI002720FBD7|nr:hypothetical protein [Patulibacter sp.]MDO9409982.1 hypothetical protein [Patulibacter sp.]